MKHAKLLVAIWSVLVFGGGVTVGAEVGDQPPDRVGEAVEVVALLPLEGVKREIRRLTEPDCQWDPSDTRLYDLEPYVVRWWSNASGKRIRLGEWVFGLSENTLPTGAVRVVSAELNWDVSHGGSFKESFFMWARREPATEPGSAPTDHE